MEKLLEGRVAIVTGSGQGIGKELALLLADMGCKVITNNRKPGSGVNAEENTTQSYSEEELKALNEINGDAETCAEAIRARGGVAIPVYADISKAEDCKRLVDTAISEFGRLDILVNNGASSYNHNIAEIPIEMWDKVVGGKLNGSFYLMHYAIPHMIKQKYGRILSASSDAFHGLMGMAPYSAANCGVWALTKTAAQDLVNHGITVNAYTPLCKTRGWYNMLFKYSQQGVDPAVLEEFAPKSMKYGPEGVAAFLAYLCTEEAGNITGLMFNVEAAGKLAVWSESKEYNVVTRDVEAEGHWTIEEIRKAVPSLMDGAVSSVTTIELH